MPKCPKCKSDMVLREGKLGQLTWICYKCGYIGSPDGAHAPHPMWF